MNNAVFRRIVVGAAYQSLSAKQEVLTVEISAAPSNVGPVLFEGDDGSEVPFIPGEFHRLERVNIGAIRCKGTPGDVVTLVGTGGGH